MLWSGKGVIAAALLGAAYPVPVDQAAESIAPPAASADIVDVVTLDGTMMTVPVHLDGNGPYSFLIDTGSERTIVAQHLASRIAMEYAAKATLIGIAGRLEVDTVYLPDLTLGKQSYAGIVAPLLQSKDVGADGILGLDSLQGQRVLFDFRKNTLSIEDVTRRGSYGYEIVVSARRKSGQLILTDAMIGGVKVNVIIDTGAQSNIGNRALQNKLLSRRAKGLHSQTSLLSVTGQSITADAGVVPDLRIGNVQFDYVPIAFADAPPFEWLGYTDTPTMLLGMGSLRGFDRVAIDFERRKVYFDLPAGARTSFN